MIKRITSILLLLFGCFAHADLKLSEERILFRTIAGDFVVRLYPKVAPLHVARIKQMIEAGLYDTTHFYRAETNFVLQLADVRDRTLPLTKEQEKLIKKIPAEFSSVSHTRGRLSMARYDEDINSAETSFSILLGDAPHLDGKYTVFGEVEWGMEVVDELVTVPRTAKNKPRIRLTVTQVKIFPNLKGLSDFGMLDLIPLTEVSRRIVQAQASESSSTRTVLMVGLILTLLLSLVALVSLRFFPPDRMGSLFLMIALIAGFSLFCSLMPTVIQSSWQGLLLFLMLLVLFKSMSYFEVPLFSNANELKKRVEK